MHSFILTISIAPIQVLYKTDALPTTARILYMYIGVSHRSAQATVGKGLAQGSYLADRAGVEPTTLRLRVIDSTNAPCTTSHMARLWPAYLIRHGPFLARLLFSNEKPACNKHNHIKFKLVKNVYLR